MNVRFLLLEIAASLCTGLLLEDLHAGPMQKTAGPENTNLIRNGDMEKIDSRTGLPNGWRIVNRSKKGRAAVNGPDSAGKIHAASGKYSLNLECEMTPDDMLGWGYWLDGSAFFGIRPGQEMLLSFYADAQTPGTQLKCYIEFRKDKKFIGTYRKVETAAPGWQKMQLRFSMPKEIPTRADIYIQLLTPGKLAADDLSLVPVSSAPAQEHAAGKKESSPETSDIIRNGGMEIIDSRTGLPEGWQIVNRSKNGEASIDTATVSAGTHSLRLKCDTVPDGYLGWGCHLNSASLSGIQPEQEMLLSLDASTLGNPDTQFKFYIEFRKGSKFIGTYRKIETIYAGWQKKQLRFKMPKEVPTSAMVYVQLLSAGQVCIDNIGLIPAPLSSKAESEKQKTKMLGMVKDIGIYCRIKAEKPGNTWFSPERPSKFTIEHFLPAPSLDVTLSEIDGNTLKSWTFRDLPLRKTGTLSLELPKLPEGAYRLTFSSGTMKEYGYFRIHGPQKHGAAFTKDGILTLGGRPFFLICINTPSYNLDAIRIYSLSGINALHIIMEEHSFLQEADILSVLDHFGLAGIERNDYGNTRGVKVPEGELRAAMRHEAGILSKHRNFIGFFSDEAPWNNVPLESLRLHYEFMFKYLPDYVAWMNQAPRLTGATEDPAQSFESVRRYARFCDVTGVDIYPVPEGNTGHNNLSDQTLSCVGKYAELSRRLSWDEKPVWMVLQGFGWSEENGKLNDKTPRPTEHQLRFMVWNAVTHGARGILWYGLGGMSDVYSEWWRGFSNVNRELAAAGAMIAAGGAGEIPGLPENVRGLSGNGLMVLVNENQKKDVSVPLKLTEEWFESPSGKAFRKTSAELSGQDVLILTRKPLAVKPAEKFSKEHVSLPIPGGVIESDAAPLDAEWVAHPDYLRGNRRRVFLRHVFRLDRKPDTAMFRASVDNSAVFRMNGVEVGNCFGHSLVKEFNIAKQLHAGENVLEAEVLNFSGPTGIVYELKADSTKISSGRDTFFSFDGKTGWKEAHRFGRPPVQPWEKQYNTIRVDSNQK